MMRGPATAPVAEPRRLDPRTYLALWVIEFSLVLLVLAVPRITEPSRMVSLPGALALLAAGTLTTAGAYVVSRVVGGSRTTRRSLGLTTVLNLLSVAAVLATVEVALRAVAVRTPYGVAVAGIPLLPRSWADEVRRNTVILRRASAEGSYLVPDDVLGWTVGPSRTSADGLSFSSVEGLRSPRPGITFPVPSGKRRIALVGDSFTFCLDVPYEHSWGHELERHLGPEFQVLNFAVRGYGVDQAYLRYLRDVIAWRPEVVIFGVFPHDLVRSMVVYPFIAFPEWDYPFSKPRFVATSRGVTPLNEPALRPETIFGRHTITDLPFLQYDWGYDPAHWRWSPLHRLYAYRFLTSVRPATPSPRDDVSDKALESVNAGVLRAFVDAVHAEGATPLVIYLPARLDLDLRLAAPARNNALAQRILTTATGRYTDLTSCVLAVRPEGRFVPGARHYSHETNVAIAQCLLPVVRAMGVSSPQPRYASTATDQN